MSRYLHETKTYELYENGALIGVVFNKKFADEFIANDETLFTEIKEEK